MSLADTLDLGVLIVSTFVLPLAAGTALGQAIMRRRARTR